MFNKLVRLIATFFYVGKFPVAPGTAASAVGLLIYVALYAHPILCVFLFLVITVLGFLASGPMEQLTGQKDPSEIVIDEVVGIMIAVFLLPITPAVMVTAFFLFRAFDMFKIYPINVLEKYENGVGIMLDDIMAGIYTNVIMHLAIKFVGGA